MSHIQKYIDMHVGTVDFELGLIAVSYMAEIYEFKNEFDLAVERYMVQQKIMNNMKKKCRDEGRCPRHNPLPERRRSQVEQDTGELESDYFGHQVPKASKKKDKKPDIVDQLFNNVERSLFEDLPEIKPTMKSDDNFTKINDWVRYLANGGLEKNKKKAEEEDEELRKEAEDELTETPSTLKPLTSKEPFANGKSPHSVNKMKDADHFDMDDDKNYKILFGAKDLEKPLPPLSPWSRPGSDIEVKKKNKQKFYDKMRGNFDPKREGIDIDLYDMF